MNRIRLSAIRDPLKLSKILDQVLACLETSPLQVPLKTLSYDTGIPETIFHRLQYLHLHPETPPAVAPQDYHILFAQIFFHYPTLKLFELEDGSLYFKL